LKQVVVELGVDASTGFIVDLYNFGDGWPSTLSPMLGCSAPFSGFRNFEPRDSPKT